MNHGITHPVTLPAFQVGFVWSSVAPGQFTHDSSHGFLIGNSCVEVFTGINLKPGVAAAYLISHFNNILTPSIMPRMNTTLDAPSTMTATSLTRLPSQADRAFLFGDQSVRGHPHGSMNGIRQTPVLC